MTILDFSRKGAVIWVLALTGLGTLGGMARATVVPAAELTQSASGTLNTYSIVLHNNSTAGEAFRRFGLHRSRERIFWRRPRRELRFQRVGHTR